MRQAVLRHRSQLPDVHRLQSLSERDHADLWSSQTFYRAMSLVNGGRAIEGDLFAGLRQPSEADEEQADGQVELDKPAVVTQTRTPEWEVG